MVVVASTHWFYPTPQTYVRGTKYAPVLDDDAFMFHVNLEEGTFTNDMNEYLRDEYSYTDTSSSPGSTARAIIAGNGILRDVYQSNFKSTLRSHVRGDYYSVSYSSSPRAVFIQSKSKIDSNAGRGQSSREIFPGSKLMPYESIEYKGSYDSAYSAFVSKVWSRNLFYPSSDYDQRAIYYLGDINAALGNHGEGGITKEGTYSFTSDEREGFGDDYYAVDFGRVFQRWAIPWTAPGWCKLATFFCFCLPDACKQKYEYWHRFYFDYISDDRFWNGELFAHRDKLYFVSGGGSGAGSSAVLIVFKLDHLYAHCRNQ